jgi:NitT/TauT family transport system substrate-binding protein
MRLRLSLVPAIALLLSACGATAAPAASSTAPKPAASSAAAPSKALTHVVVGSSTLSSDLLPVFVAKDAGIFEKNGLDVEIQFLSGASNAMAALLSGNLQMVQLAGAGALNAAASGGQIAVVATLTPVYPYRLEVPASIKTPADLKGKKLGTGSIGGTVELATRTVLEQAGLTPGKDVTLVSDEGPQNIRVAALQAGAVQGAMSSPPNTLTLEANGYHPLFDLASQHVPADLMITGTSGQWISGHRDAVQAYVDSLVQGIARAKQDKAFTVGVLKKYFKSDDDTAMGETWDFYTHEVFPDLPYPKPEQFAADVAESSKTNDKMRSIDLGKLLDASFVKSADDRGLISAK